MTLATENEIELTNANDDDDAPNTEKAKRERVDLEALDPNERVQFSVTMPAGLKLALIKAGEAEKIAGSAHARNLLANAVGYTVPDSFNERTRSHKYATPEEAKAATANAAKERRELMKKIMAAAKNGDIDLAALGISV